MSPRWTVRALLRWIAEDLTKRGVDSPRLDADLLVADALECSRIQLYLDMDKPLADAELAEVRSRVARRRDREPVAYILGHREFYGRPFDVTPAVLIPRPDTETLVDAALATIPSEASGRLLDLCTGSGAIGLTLAAERPQLDVLLTDCSEEALSVARGNAKQLGVSDRVRFVASDLFHGIAPDAAFDWVTCNPPYVSEAEWESLEDDVRRHEPSDALLAGPDGLRFYRRFAEELRGVAASSRLFLELGAGQSAAVRALLSTERLEVVEVHADLAGIDRVLEVVVRF